MFPETQSALTPLLLLLHGVQTLCSGLSYALSDWTLLKGSAEIIKFLERLMDSVMVTP